MVGFVGKEWNRKGLPLAVEAMALLRHKRPFLEFRVIGADPAAVQHLFADWTTGYSLTPWSGEVPYPELDILLHPARAEPLGMVITEAMSARLPVVVSDVCGAAEEVSTEAGSVLSLDKSVQDWADAVDRLLERRTPAPSYVRGWEQVAGEYEDIYADLQGERS
ncbi:glycosyltransferase family 4 protein [Rhodoferax sp. BAB1]|uniref:glycosyltransferase family 4 protein n=1 Tax=Rhodoferax sp. BAB1 TaxID=2741720 RepID=UPI001C2D58DB|nr:glycosyltransferase family 4 protein [Rhodoferax sp. BAB1]